MDWKTFIIEFINATIWPLTLVVIINMLKKPIIELLPQATKLKINDFEVEFEKELVNVRQELQNEEPGDSSQYDEPLAKNRYKQLMELAAILPNASVLQAWNDVESATLRLLLENGYSPDSESKTQYKDMQEALQKDGLLADKNVKIFNDLRNMRNRVTHASGYNVSSSQAVAYIDLSLSFRGILDKAMSNNS